MIGRTVLMGVSGCGKSTIGRALSVVTGVRYLDGDDLHPAANIAKMQAGHPLDDDDRWPWLRLVGQALREVPVIVGCSALKRSYRDLLRAEAGPILFVHLTGDPAVIAARMSVRTAHFMPEVLLQSQLETLEPPVLPEDTIAVDIDQPVAAIVDVIRLRMQALR